ncbi:MAG TPA: phosphopantetheine-binding protein [Candidatus Binataceae bacterium]|nr:phosphopantetheine-binding protein [Candidatus Binataceae bacterium]
MQSISREHIEYAIKEILVTNLEMDRKVFDADCATTPLLGRGIGLDSVDALTLVTALEERFEIEVDDPDLTVNLFESITTLADYVLGQLSRGDRPN